MSESNEMAVGLTQETAAPQWGENALLSYTQNQAMIHVPQQNALGAIQTAGRKLAAQGLMCIKLVGEWDLEQIWAFYQGSCKPKHQIALSWPVLSEADDQELTARIQAVSWLRDIVNASGELIGPRQLASKAASFIQSVAPADTISYRLVQEKDLLNEGWIGTYQVGRGSSRTSTMLQLDYNPTQTDSAPVDTAIVGKGITFDSGGYSLKQSSFMDAMKADMGGAALATAALALAISRGLNKRTSLILCCAENMVSGNAFKLGDILTYKNGKTVEVMNTDAEGRLVLADGLIYADELQPRRIIDCATLTGAAKVALGNDYHALFSFDQQMVADMLECAQAENERLWSLPLDEIHRTMMPSHFADLSNAASGQYTPGASTAAAFLSYFVGNYQQNWLHIDCSATYRKTASDCWAVGATGQGVRSLARLLMQ